ncbi:MAG: protein-export chaperone SecB [Flavobacteriales bacterium]|nr:protein-export chaperone SecB [Flavobacteriales bacterium]
MVEEAISQYHLKRIALVKSVFDRAQNFYEPQKELSLKVNIKHEEGENAVTVFVNVTVLEDQGKLNNLTLDVTMAGEFEYKSNGGDELDLNFKEFVKVNAPAIIYPYVRQHIRNLTLDAGFKQPIILPILNFVRLQEKSEENPSG